MNNFISCERKNKMPKIECVVLNAVKDLVLPVILRSAARKDLALDFQHSQVPRFFGHEPGLRMTPLCRPEQSERPGFAFERPLHRILQAFALQNDTISFPADTGGDCLCFPSRRQFVYEPSPFLR